MHSEVPEGWQDCLFGDVVQIDWGDTSVTKKSYTEHGYIAFSAAGGDGHLPYFDYEKEGVVVSAIGANSGRVFWARGKWSAIKNTMVVFPKNGSSISKFIYYRAQLDGFWTIGGGAQPFIGLGNARKQKFPLPPLAEQERIAEILTSVDDSIRATECVIEQAERVKRGLMEELLTGGLGSAAIERGEVPADWKSFELKSALDKVIDYRGKAPPKAPFGVPLITARNVRKGNLSLAHKEYIDESLYESWMNRGIPKANDVLFTTEAPLGNVALYPKNGVFALGQRIVTLQCSTSLKSLFLFYFLLSPFAEKQISKRATGSTALGIKSKELMKISILLPSISQQEHITEILASVDEEISANRNSVEQLQRVKRGLMDDLLTGKVRTV